VSWGPEGVNGRIQFAMEAFAVIVAAYGLTRITSDSSCSRRAPLDDDPEQTLQARFLGKLGHLGLTLLAVLIAWDQMR
jgi:hypothetical protein